MITSKQASKMGTKSALKRFGLRMVMSVFPVEGGKHRATLGYQGKEYTFASVSRLQAMDEAFGKWKTLVNKSLK